MPRRAVSALVDGSNSSPCDLSITANTTMNSLSSPGLLVIVNGTLNLKGSSTFYGVIRLGVDVQGRVTAYAPEGFGFIHCADGELIYVNAEQVSGESKSLKIGQIVEFDVALTHKGPRAINVIPLRMPDDTAD